MARVLVVDDEGSARRLVRLILESEGHEVVEAQDGRYALSALEQEGPFDVLVLDLMMPWVDGWEVLKNLEWSPPRVIVLSAREDEYAEERAERTHPVYRYIIKPYEPDELIDAVRDALTA